MTDMFDIFRVETTGPRWLESASTLARAKSRVRELGAYSPGNYLVLDQVKRIKLRIKIDASERPNSKRESSQ